MVKYVGGNDLGRLLPITASSFNDIKVWYRSGERLDEDVLGIASIARENGSRVPVHWRSLRVVPASKQFGAAD